MESTLSPQTGRLDRHVRRSVLRVGEGVSRHRIAYSIEEALRLVALPGEEEGRIYCLRRVSFAGIPAEANRRIWIEQVQRVLNTIAAQVVHAGDPSAGAANAVYFHNIEEALEILLRRAVRATGGARWSTPEWFANSALGMAPESSYAAQIPAILERLRPPSMAPAAAASILFAALGDADPVPLLTALPIATLREWVRELDAQTSHSASAQPVQLPGEVKTTLQRAASHFGWKDPATVWLAAQAVLALSPGALNSGTVMKRARATLRFLEEEQLREPQDRTASAIRGAASSTQLVFDDDERAAVQLQPLKNEPADCEPQDQTVFAIHSDTSSTQPVLDDDERAAVQLQPFKNEAANREPDDEIALQPSRATTDEDRSTKPAPTAQETVADVTLVELPKHPVAKPTLLGEATQAAGLYFLLNTLRSLGIVRALEACPALAEAEFASHILRQLAAETNVADDDPILFCLRLSRAKFALHDEILANLPLQPKVWPKGFAASRRTNFNAEFYLRVWTVATKLWLWRMGRLTLREVVNRYGHVWLTRTDLDVTFPLAAADLRIRRIGLDIDPGWLPWLGECGRVVRFHYRDRESEEPAC